MKGRVDVDVPIKDQRAHVWAVDASQTTGVPWQYVRLDQEQVEPLLAAAPTYGEVEDVVWARRREALEATLPLPRKRSREEVLALMDRVSERTRGHDIDVDAAVREVRDGGW
jgi:hypothetical protein